MEYTDIESEVRQRGWKWATNGLSGPTLQVNITICRNVFCWWPLSEKQTLYHKKPAGISGEKFLKVFKISPEWLIRHIEQRLTQLYGATNE